MYQIDVPSAAPAMPAPASAGTPGFFTDGNPALGVLATIVTADWLNAVQGELIALVQAAGITPAKTQDAQVLAAVLALIESRGANYATDVGTLNAYVVALSPPVTAYTNGLQVRFKTARANTSACTLDAGAGPVPLVRNDGQALASADITAGVIGCTYDLPTNKFYMDSFVESQVVVTDFNSVLYSHGILV